MSGIGAKSTRVPAALAKGLGHKCTTRGPLGREGLGALHEQMGTGTSSSCLTCDLSPHYSLLFMLLQTHRRFAVSSKFLDSPTSGCILKAPLPRTFFP